MLVGHLVHQQSREVRTAGAQLVLNMAATLHLDDDEVPEFFKSTACLRDLTETLLKICGVGPQAFADEDVRQRHEGGDVADPRPSRGRGATGGLALA